MLNGHPLTHPCRWGLLGLSRIARHYAAPALQAIRPEAITAVATTSPAKAQAWREQFPKTTVHATYAALLQDPNVDAVYVSLPHHLHASWAIQAIKAGKHVLVEKPLTLNQSQAAAVLAAAKAQQVLVAEGFMWQHQARTQQIHAIATNPHHPQYLGPLKAIVGTYSFYEANIENPAAWPTDFRLADEAGGGALHDIGCYLLNLAQLFMPAPLKVSSAHSELLPGTKTVDVATSFTLTWPYGTGIFACRYDTGFLGQQVDLIFRHGKITWPWPFNPPQDPQYLIYTEQQADPFIHHVAEEDPFIQEFKHFEQNLAQKTFTYPLGQSEEHFVAQASYLEKIKALGLQNQT